VSQFENALTSILQFANASRSARSSLDLSQRFRAGNTEIRSQSRIEEADG
jgi:hypothetical protein